MEDVYAAIPVRLPETNGHVQKLYQEWLEGMDSMKVQETLHTKYSTEKPASSNFDIKWWPIRPITRLGLDLLYIWHWQIVYANRDPRHWFNMWRMQRTGPAFVPCGNWVLSCCLIQCIFGMYLITAWYCKCMCVYLRIFERQWVSLQSRFFTMEGV